MSKFADRVATIEPFYVMELLAQAQKMEQAGRDIIHMEIGEPDFQTAPSIITAGQKALADGLTHYSPALGLPALREAIARDYMRKYGVCVKPEQVVVTAGASGALLLVLSLLINPGDGVLLPDPGYPCNRHFLSLIGGEYQSLRVTTEAGFQLNGKSIDSAWQSNTVATLLASPANPTGMVLKKACLQSVSDAVVRRDGHLVLDEIYHGLNYDSDCSSVLEVNPNAFVVNSFSKYFGMTGWRLGWLIAPEDAVPSLEKLAQNVFIAASTIAQHAALAAFEPEAQALFETQRLILKERRDFLYKELGKLGLGLSVKPEGAFYIYANVKHLTNDSYAFCQGLLEAEGVAITPGVDFGSYGANEHVRFAYTTDLNRLAQAVERIARFIKR